MSKQLDLSEIYFDFKTYQREFLNLVEDYFLLYYRSGFNLDAVKNELQEKFQVIKNYFKKQDVSQEEKEAFLAKTLEIIRKVFKVHIYRDDENLEEINSHLSKFTIDFFGDLMLDTEVESSSLNKKREESIALTSGFLANTGI